jgi:hypothetical protein
MLTPDLVGGGMLEALALANGRCRSLQITDVGKGGGFFDRVDIVRYQNKLFGS